MTEQENDTLEADRNQYLELVSEAEELITRLSKIHDALDAGYCFTAALGNGVDKLECAVEAAQEAGSAPGGREYW
jgi:hypothetical protein